MFNKKCIICGKEFQTFANQRKYCGDERNKTGCAYEQQIRNIAIFNKYVIETHPEKIRPVWKKASNKYRSKL